MKSVPVRFKLTNQLCRLMVGLLLSMFAFKAMAVVETYEFDSDNNRERYQVFIEELRCPKCQNQNLSGSNSPIAADLRRELHRMIEEGQSDDAIKTFMVDRYGNFVLYRPPVDKNTILLWGTPALLVLIGLVVVIMIRRKNMGQSGALSDAEKQRVDQILEQYR
ncbi:Cytochrome c-type biogenesis protein CcmH [BD1-7 clade bacterium]|uniref:Cytochrome c-type biogenesis protein n=1 Tax=BD1-7 clade bacterium TaxID=2029982 RepID=A0A5S9NM85_9GAMM|nr:Cytochrome c-type biogenesis protein CcmH [BD1-7 clade bacterium]CAA0093680.1 Cytochrome c-type biogenesis protein CcmH [BD1-7 clade bacterium]